MTKEQWEALVAVTQGKWSGPPPVGLIIDSPWLPPWLGMDRMDYFTSERCWLDANLKVVEAFPEVLFLPGFWSEYAMATEPSAFGAKCVWPEGDLPFAEQIIDTMDDIGRIKRPNPRRDGLLPFVIKRLQQTEARINDAGHGIYFAVARGPMNIAAFLMGTTEFLTALRMLPDEVHGLLDTITSFLEEWLQYQKECFPSIDGILLLDDIVGFTGEEDFREFSQPYLKRAFHAFDATVRFFHNDAEGAATAQHCEEIGINLFNFSFQHSIAEMQRFTNGNVALLGNIPPRDVLAVGGPEEVREAIRASLDGVEDMSRVILSCGGGTPPGVPTENIHAMLEARDSLGRG